ncbi:MAG: LamG-like jellyroll fold domain-containing protein [Candidatus Paceibacterota bacterium]|jgi:prepilin-type N-terminal cleavage/methylation domain-containing protein
MKQKAFTLIELLVVIAIVGILSSVIYTNITGLRDRARVTAGIRFDSSTLHSIGDQLVGEWTFDMPQVGSLTYDTSGSNNHGTVSDATYATTSGYNGKGAYNLNGAGYIIVPYSSILAPTSEVSFGAWAYSSSWGSMGNSRILSKTEAGGYNIEFDVQGAGMVNAAVNLSGTYYVATFNYTGLSSGWHHFFVTCDGRFVKLYIDGTLKKSTDSGSAKSITYTYSNALCIGAEVTATVCGGSLWPGSIDDARIYSSALSSSNIQKLYAEGRTSHEVATK